MKKLKYDGFEYSNLLHKNEKELLKISALPAEVWKTFCDKNLKFANSPIEYRNLTEEEIEKCNKTLSCIRTYRSVITLPYLKDYKTLYDTVFDGTFTTKDILQLLKKNMNILKDIHKNEVTHGDIHTSNIMINQNHDIEFIDFDSGTVNKYISEENHFIFDFFEHTTKEQIKATLCDDKISLLVIYLSYLSRGHFKKDQVLTDDLSFDKTHRKALQDIMKEKDTNDNYYYLDFIDSLISTDYQSPIVYSKNIRHKYGK